MSNHTTNKPNGVTFLAEEFPRLNTPDVRIVRAEDLERSARILMVTGPGLRTSIVEVKSITVNELMVEMVVSSPNIHREVSCAPGVQFVQVGWG